MDPYEDYVGFWSDACHYGGGRVEGGPTTRLLGPPGNLPVYGVVRFEGNSDEAVEEARTWMARGAPFSFVSTDVAVTEALGKAGMMAKNNFVLVHGPVADLGPPDHHVTWSTSGADAMSVQAPVHGIPEAVVDNAIQSIDGMIRAKRAHVVVAWDDGTPVGCATLYSGQGNAGIYGASVDSSRRRQGIGRSLAQALMIKARELGLARAVAVTTPDGLALSRALGCQEVGQIAQSVWFPDVGVPG